jgi:hypothetical protein
MKTEKNIRKSLCGDTSEIYEDMKFPRTTTQHWNGESLCGDASENLRGEITKSRAHRNSGIKKVSVETR